MRRKFLCGSGEFWEAYLELPGPLAISVWTPVTGWGQEVVCDITGMAKIITEESQEVAYCQDL